MKLFLHIGTEKTGTTSLQHFLKANSDPLSKQGIYYSDNIGGEVGRGVKSNWMLPAYFTKDRHLQKELHELFLQRQESPESFLATFRKEIKEAEKDHSRVIISSEFFSSRLTSIDEVRLLGDYLKSIFDEIKIICYVREQSEVVKGLYSGLLKGGRTDALDDVLLDAHVGNQSFNYDSMLSKWAEIFEFKEVSIYKKNRLRNEDIRFDFLFKVDESLDFSKLNFGIVESNESISYLQCFIIRLINSHFKDSKKHILIDLILKKDEFKIGKIKSELDLMIYDRFDESNKIFFGKFFGEDKNLFDPPDKLTGNFFADRNIPPDFIDNILFKAILDIINYPAP